MPESMADTSRASITAPTSGAKVNVWPEYPVGQSAEDLKERYQWTTPIVFSPVDPKILYTSSQHLFKTTDSGQSWTTISPDLTRHDPATLGPSGGPITHAQTGVETYATIFSIADIVRRKSLPVADHRRAGWNAMARETRRKAHAYRE
jgi:hypothetical protein